MSGMQAFWREPLSPNLHICTNLEALSPGPFGVLWRPHYSYDQLNLWTLMMNPTFRPSPLPGLKVQSSNHLAGSPGDQPPSLGGFTSHLFNIK